MFKHNNYNLNDLQDHIVKVVAYFLLANVVSFAIFFMVLFKIDSQKKINLFKESVKNANTILQMDVSNQLIIIANNSTFIDYLNFGDISRKKYYLKMLWLFSELDSNLISGIRIYKNEDSTPIFSYGKYSNFYTTIYLCYIGNRINSTFGGCNNKLQLFFNKNAYIEKLNTINPSLIIDPENNGFLFTPFKNSFGTFNTDLNLKNNFGYINFKVNINSQIIIIFSILLALAFSIIFFLLSHKVLKSIITKNLITPLMRITDSLKNNYTLDTKQLLLAELQLLVDVVNEHNTQQVNSAIHEMAARVAHDITNPVNGAVMVIPKIKKNCGNTSEIQLLESYISQISAISSDIIEHFRKKSSNEIVVAINSLNTPIFILLTDFIENIIKQNHQWSDNCQIYFEFKDILWIHDIPIKIHRALSNLIKNAYESLTLVDKVIGIEVLKNKNFATIIIKDSGCGISKEQIELVLKGKSLKHSGKGLGLSSAVEYLKTVNGFLALTSTPETGTTVTISIPQTTPPWLKLNLFYDDNDIFIIYEDNIEIISLWQKLLLPLYNKKMFFTEISSLTEWTNNTDNKSNVIFLSNYDLIKQIVWLDKFITQNTYIVSTNIFDHEAQLDAIKYKYFLIPFSLLKEFKLFYKNLKHADSLKKSINL